MKATEPNMQPLFRRGTLSALNAAEVFSIMQLRQQVFVLEQQCLYPDMDMYDAPAIHVLMYTAGNLMGTARILPPHSKYPEVSIGRVAVAEHARGKNMGRALMVYAINCCHELFPGVTIKISAQHRLEKFYGSLGFITITPPYDEDGIMHVDMVITGK